MKPEKDPGEASAAWEDATSAFLRARGWRPQGATLLLAVSGGADSTALARYWARRGAAEFACRLHIVHVDHKLRPAASDDRDFVVSLCDELQLPCRVAELDPASRPARESPEMWARRERYRVFSEAAAEAGAAFVLTAHHRDDAVETVFQRLARGTGPRGLSGIPFQRPAADRKSVIVRPFLNRTRAEILAYLASLNAAWRDDESNLDSAIERNWFRHHYLPALRASEPDLDARVFALSQRMQALRPALDRLEEADAILHADAEGKFFLPASELAARIDAGDEESVAFWLRRLLRASEPGAGMRPNPVTREILIELLRQWRSGAAELQVPLSPAWAFKRRNRRIYCEALSLQPRKRARAGKKSGAREEQKVILVHGSGAHVWRWGDRSYRLSARTYPKPRGLAFPDVGGKRAIFDADLFSCTLVVRTRQNGDRFSPYGVNSESRKLKVFLNEEKIPAEMRDELPILLSGETLAWVPGHGTSEFFKVTGSTTRILEVVLECENP